MKKIIFLVCSFLITTFLNAQSVPAFQWAKSLGGTGHESSSSITTDAAGNVYSIGSFYAAGDFDPGPGVYNLNGFDSADIFISKLDASGNFVWAKEISGTSNDFPFAIATDANGNVYATGRFAGTADFDPGVAGYTLTTTSVDQFILKLDAAGNFIWAKQVGAPGVTTIGHSIEVDAAGDVYTTGTFEGTVDFDPGVASYTLASLGYTDVFVSKTDANGNFVWANSFGSIGSDFVRTLAVDPTGNVYTCGSFSDITDFDPSASGSYTLASVSGSDMFVSVIDASGVFIFAQHLGGPTGSALAVSMDIDNQNSIYITGYFSGTTDFDPGAGVSILSAVGNSDVFVLKLDPGGNFVWVKNTGGTNSSCIAATIKTDASQNVYVLGYYDATVDFDPGPAINNINSTGMQDAFLLKLDPSGNFIWVKKFGASGMDIGRGLALDQASNIHLTGSYQQGADFDPTAGITTLSALGGSDVFIVKLSQTIVGIYENSTAYSLNAFPNPAKDIVNISFDEESFIELTNSAKIEVYNALGKCVLRDNISSRNVKLNIKNLTEGVFILNIINNGSVLSTKKIVKY